MSGLRRKWAEQAAPQARGGESAAIGARICVHTLAGSAGQSGVMGSITLACGGSGGGGKCKPTKASASEQRAREAPPARGEPAARR